MKFFKLLAKLVLPIAMLIPSVSNAEIIFPALDIQKFGADTGLTMTDVGTTSTTLDIDATVIAIILDSIGTFDDIADQPFTLTATGSSTLTSMGSFTFISGLFDGSFAVGAGGSLLSGTFSGLEISGLDTQPLISGNVSYTGGTLQGNLTGGRLELATAGSSVAGKLGAVVPVPAAVWLFGSGLIGLVGIARRKA